MSTTSTEQKLISQLLLEDADLRDIVEEFVDGLQGRIDELVQAHDQLDWDTLQTLAHRLKGAGGSYGYPQLSELGATMENAFKTHEADQFVTWLHTLEELTAAAKNGLNDG